MNKKIQTVIAALALVSPVTLVFATKPALVAPVVAQGEATNPAEFTLTDFNDAARGLSFKRPTSWTQDATYKDGVRFAGGDEWLTLQILESNKTPEQFTASFVVPSDEKNIGVKPFRQGAFRASVFSTSATGKSSVTGKATDLLIDHWVFSPKAGKLVVLTVSGPKKVFDWEGNRDMALSVRLK